MKVLNAIVLPEPRVYKTLVSHSMDNGAPEDAQCHISWSHGKSDIVFVGVDEQTPVILPMQSDISTPDDDFGSWLYPGDEDFDCEYGSHRLCEGHQSECRFWKHQPEYRNRKPKTSSVLSDMIGTRTGARTGER